MKRFYCKGKKGYCDRGNDDNIDCKNCEFANGKGGEVVDAPDTNYDRIRNMSVKELAELLDTCDNEVPPYCRNRKTCGEECMSCAKEWLESEVTEE